MAKGRGNRKGAPQKRTGTPRPMNKPAMMDWALRLLRLLNERKVLTSRVVAEEFDVNIRTAQRYLLYLSDLPCVVVDEEKHTYSLTSDYVITDKILNTSEMAVVCALIDYATHIFGTARTTRPTVVWSQWSGYLKKGGPVPSYCYENGIEPYIIHSGGHAHPEDLADLARRLHPRAVVPIHTEAASQFAAFIPNVRVVTDGEAVEVASLIADNDAGPSG